MVFVAILFFTIRKLDKFVQFSNGLVTILFLPFENQTNWYGFQMAQS
jgi:hypothetical protein